MSHEVAEIELARSVESGSHQSVAAQAARIASRVTWRPRSPEYGSAPTGRGTTRTAPYVGQSDEIDLERSLEALTGRAKLVSEDIFVRERVFARRGVVFAADVSGSMEADSIETAAAAVGALTWGLRREDLAVLAFWSDAMVLAPVGVPPTLPEVVAQLANIRPRGLTNIAFPLDVSQSLLRQMRPRAESLYRVILLSDCVHNAGPDPLPYARRLPRLDVLLDASRDHDANLASELARAGRGALRVIRRQGDVVSGLNALFQ